MKVKKISMLLLIAAGSVAAAWGANFPCGTYIVVGAVKNHKNQVIGSAAGDNAYRMQAIAANGTILAESAIYAPNSNDIGDNFRLEVPLTTQGNATTAKVGDSVRLVLAAVSNNTTTAIAAASGTLRIPNAMAYTNLVLQIYATTAFTNKSGTVVNIPNDYLSSIASYLDGATYPKTYDPFADYDGDGASNYQEYLAATDPFNKTDKLSIRTFKHGGSRVAISFEYNGGIVYAVSSSPTLGKGASWSAEGVATTEAATPSDKQVLINADAAQYNIGEATLYMLPTEGARSMFYKLEVK